MESEKIKKVKICTGCLEAKPLDDFTPDKNGKFGRKAKCRQCVNAAGKKARLRSRVTAGSASASVKKEKAARIISERSNGQLQVVLDLFGYQEVLEALEEQARIHIRTPAGQALFYVISALKKESNASERAQG